MRRCVARCDGRRSGCDWERGVLVDVIFGGGEKSALFVAPVYPVYWSGSSVTDTFSRRPWSGPGRVRLRSTQELPGRRVGRSHPGSVGWGQAPGGRREGVRRRLRTLSSTPSPDFDVVPPLCVSADLGSVSLSPSHGNTVGRHSPIPTFSLA